MNAVVSATGKIIVFSGLLKAIDSSKAEDEIATVLGHDIAHVIAGHRIEHQSIDSLTYWILAPIVPLAYGSHIVRELVIFTLPFGIVAGLVCSLMFRHREKEADYTGMLLMTEAGFDPQGAVTFWENVNKWREEWHRLNPKAKGLSEFASSHPHVSS